MAWLDIRAMVRAEQDECERGHADVVAAADKMRADADFAESHDPQLALDLRLCANSVTVSANKRFRPRVN